MLNDPGALESPVSGRQISVEVLDAHGRLLARSPSLGAEVLPQGGVARAALRDGHAGSERVTSAGVGSQLYAAPIADAGGPAAGGAVLVASDTTDITQTTGRLAGLVALVGGDRGRDRRARGRAADAARAAAAREAGERGRGDRAHGIRRGGCPSLRATTRSDS